MILGEPLSFSTVNAHSASLPSIPFVLTLSRRVSLPLLSLLPVPGIGLFLISASRSHASFIKDSRMLAKTQLTYRRTFPKKEFLGLCYRKGAIGEWKRRSDPPDDKLNSALLLSRRTYPPRDSWNFCGLRWGKSTKARQIDRLLSRC
ncbi:hypothetical protein LIER_34315 [Lithospermum erythrorhizon]|uniref:Uncharacterized protein n=1 Tax=Lithospermum erythrorhizon TaxID=34254 RepID=A0AAV3S0L7_LITER